MALNSSGPISIAGTTAGQSIQIELGGTGSTQMSLNCASVRTLAGVPTGAIVMPTNFYGKSNTVPFGCATYGTAGTFTFTVPSGVSKISVVCVGSSGSGAQGCDDNDICGGGSGGGALSFTNCIPVTSGESLTVVVGAGSPFVGRAGTPGNTSSVARGATILISAQGSRGGKGYSGGSPCLGPTGTSTGAGGQASAGVGAVKYSGGNGNCFSAGTSSAGGGAAGYAGNGGSVPGSGGPGSSGSGGGGGGGGATAPFFSGSGGGGVGLVVQGASGAGGTSSAGGGGGSGGAPGGACGIGGIYGGGSKGGYQGGSCPGIAGTRGGVRIIYGGTGKSYPSNSAP